MSGENFALASPCNGCCQLDGGSGLCRGCFRTMDEIASWWLLSERERATVMRRLESRRSHFARTGK